MGSARRTHVRRVGFRSGTERELMALHAIEAQVSAECGSHRMPQLLASYISFARNLPSQFDDHAWLAEAGDGTPVAAAFCWSNAAGDARVMECDVLVRADRRREGIASRLFAQICDVAATEARPVLMWSTFSAVPAGEAFSRHLGARAARINRTSELCLADVDWQMIERWADGAAARACGYRLEMVDGPFPEHLRGDAATLHHIMQTAPRDDLDIGDVFLDAGDVAEIDGALAAAERTRWTALVRDQHGVCVGGTEIIFEPHEPTIALQQNTGIDPAHRGRGLAKWAKATMLERIQVERPRIERVRTDNASSNAAMLAINGALGFTVICTRTEWQADIAGA